MEDEERTTVPTIPDEISGLLERRSTFREWLGNLEQRAGDVRPEVYERVREDYLERLAGVESDLDKHREGLEESLGARRARMEELERERDEAAARLEEAELRHSVGEYSEEEWEARSGEHRGALGELEGRLDEEQQAVERLEEVLGELDAPAPGSAPAPEAAGTGTAAVASEPATGGRAEATGGAREVVAGGGESETAPEDADDGGDRPVASRAFAHWRAGRMPEPTVSEATAPATAGTEAEGSRPDEGASKEDDVLAFLSGGTAAGAEEGEAEGSGFEDELDFLESLSLDDADSLNTLSLVLDEGEEGEDEEEDEREGDGAA